MAPRGGQTSVAAAVALLLGQREGTVRQRWREWRYAAQDQRGQQRRAVEEETGFAPLRGGVLRWWEPAEPHARRLALTLDATRLGTRVWGGGLGTAVCPYEPLDGLGWWGQCDKRRGRGG